jgi:hypothetical protein
MNQEELNEVLELHKMWLDGEPEGRRAYLYRAALRRADLRSLSFQRSYLAEADLSGADLRGATLFGADLSKANLTGANLRKANLGRACLKGALISEANLSGANLIGASLRFTNLSGAKLPQGCKYHVDLPKHDILIIHDVAHIGCRSMPLTEWLKHGPEIGRPRGYTEDQIDLYMEILRREHEARRAK